MRRGRALPALQAQALRLAFRRAPVIPLQVAGASALQAAVVEKARGQAIPVLDPAVADVEAGADDDLVAAGAHLLHLLQGGGDALGLAPAAALRRLGLDGPDVAIEHQLEALDDVARVGEAADDEVGEERGCVGRIRLGWLHGAVPFVPVIGSGGVGNWSSSRVRRGLRNNGASEAGNAIRSIASPAKRALRSRR